MRRKLILNETIKIMSQEQVEQIAYRWHYREKSEYAIYNISSNEETLKEILDPDRREKMYYVVGKDEIFGFFRFEQIDSSTITMKLGMIPQLNGIGNGYDFIRSRMDFAIDFYNPETIQISIESFNNAIKLFKEIGFKEVDRTMREFKGKSIECLIMTYRVDEM